jgi:hypothetical protein
LQGFSDISLTVSQHPRCRRLPFRLNASAGPNWTAPPDWPAGGAVVIDLLAAKVKMFGVD